MAELDDILAEYDFAETIEVTVAGDKLTATVAEAHVGRNRAFGRAMLRVAKEHGIDDGDSFPEELEIELFTETLLKKWNLTKDGKPVPVEDAAEVFGRDRAGLLLFRELGAICAQPARFLGQPSKKKPSSTTSRKASLSAKAQKPSKSKPKAAASRSQRASKDT